VTNDGWAITGRGAAHTQAAAWRLRESSSVHSIVGARAAGVRVAIVTTAFAYWFLQGLNVLPYDWDSLSAVPRDEKGAAALSVYSCRGRVHQSAAARAGAA